MNNVNSSGHIEHLIETYLADGLSHEERISFESHCAGCQVCAEALEQAREFEEKVFQSLAPDKSPAHLEDLLVKTFRAKVPKPQSRRMFRPFSYLFRARLLRWASIPLAALILIVIGNMVMTGGMQGFEIKGKISQPTKSPTHKDEVTYNYKIENNGTSSSDYSAKGTGSVGDWTVDYYGDSAGGNDITTESFHEETRRKGKEDYQADIMVKKGSESDKGYYSDGLGGARPYYELYTPDSTDKGKKYASAKTPAETADNEWSYIKDIDGVVQEIEDKSTWSSGDAMRIFFEDDGTGGGTRGVEVGKGREVSAGAGKLDPVILDFSSFGTEEMKERIDGPKPSVFDYATIIGDVFEDVDGGGGELGKLAWEEPARKTSVLSTDPIIVSLSEPSDVREGLTEIRESTGQVEENTEVMASLMGPVEPAVSNRIARMPILLATNALNPQQKIIKSGTLTFEVESFDKAYQQVVKIITEAKGYVASSSATKLPNGKVRGQIVIRVLPELFDAVTLRLRVLGELKNQSVTAEDITKKYFDLQARLKNARAMEERLIKLATEKTGKVEDLLKVEKELGNTREKIECFQGELKYYNNLCALATIRLEINEKDIEKPFEYVQTQSANLSLAVANVVTAYHQAQAMVHALDGQIVEARMTDQNKRIAGIVKAYVDAEYFDGLMEDMKGLGEVKSAVAEQRRTSSSGKASADKGTKVRKERGLVNLTLNPPAGEYIQTKRARIILKSTDVHKAYAQAQEMAAQVKAKILNGKLNRETDRVIGQLFCQVEPEGFRPLINGLRSIAEVKSCSVEEHQTARGIDPKSMLQAPIRKEPGRIELVIISPAPIMPKEGGISATLKKTLKGSFGGLLWSLERLVVGVATIGPWLLILILVFILARRYFRRSSKKEEVK